MLRVTPGRWSPEPDEVTYQWLANGRPVSTGGPTLSLDPALRDRSLSVRLTAHRTGYDDVRWTSPATLVEPGTLSVSVEPAVSGSTRLGGTLTVSAPASAPESAVEVQWLRGGRPVPGATEPGYRISAADLGRRLSAEVRYVRDGYTTVTRETAPSRRAKAVPRLRAVLRRGAGRLDVEARVSAAGVPALDGVLRVRSRGRLLAEVPVHDGAATAALTNLSAGTRTVRLVLLATETVARGVLERQVTVR
jgi:hypothetical protein